MWMIKLSKSLSNKDIGVFIDPKLKVKEQILNGNWGPNNVMTESFEEW